MHQLPYFEVARRLEQDNLDVLSEVRRFEEKAEGMRDERDRMRDVVAEAVRHLNEAKAKLEKYEPKMAELERKVDTSRQMAYYEQEQHKAIEELQVRSGEGGGIMFTLSWVCCSGVCCSVRCSALL